MLCVLFGVGLYEFDEHSCHDREGFARNDFVVMGAQRWQTYEAGVWRKAGCLCARRESLIRSGSVSRHPAARTEQGVAVIGTVGLVR
jgi:hypothetical protein